MDERVEILAVFQRFPKFGFDIDDVHLFLPYEVQEQISKDDIRRVLRNLSRTKDLESLGQGRWRKRKIATVPPPPPEPEPRPVAQVEREPKQPVAVVELSRCDHGRSPKLCFQCLGW